MDWWGLDFCRDFSLGGRGGGEVGDWVIDHGWMGWKRRVG